MNKWIKKISAPLTAFLTAALLFPLPMAGTAQQDTGDPVTHQVSVDVMVVPIFAIDGKGKPVFDLKREDLDVYANGRPAQVAQFVRYDFKHREETAPPAAVKKPAVRTPTRALFLIIDSVFNGVMSFRRTKQIAIDIIENSSPDDMIIVVENRAGGGPRHLAGPDESRKSIIRKIKSLRLPSGKFSRNLYLTREWNAYATSDGYTVVHSSAALENLAANNRLMDRMAYKNQAMFFSGFLSQFKYALKTIKRPKVVFLISEGVAKGAFKAMQGTFKAARYKPFDSVLTRPEKTVADTGEARDMQMFQGLRRVVHAINEGGSVMYTINPGKFRRDTEASGEMSLRFLASESGGQYIAGSDAKKIVEKIKDTTAAYYELAFVVTPDMGRSMDLEINCKREDVTVKSVRHAEQAKPYYRMDPIEKKLFALNMVTGGSWSRMVGKVVRVKFRKLRNDKSNGETAVMIEVPLPRKMAGRTLDIFSIQLDPRTQQAGIELVSRAVKDRANLIIKRKSSTHEFFVIIEPVFAYCVYNKV